MVPSLPAVAVAAALLLTIAPAAAVLPNDSPAPADARHPSVMHHHGVHNAPGGGCEAGEPDASAPPQVPQLAGQDAFGAIQEIVGILEADPATDWSRVDLERLRQHLIDMSEVTLRASVEQAMIEGGIEVKVTGSGPTIAAIQRMVPAHIGEIDAVHLHGWSAQSALLPNGTRASIVATDPSEIRHIRGLGFIGVLVSGAHHRRHHLAMARGEMAHD